MAGFYSQLADDYDSMTRFDSRLDSMRKTLGQLVNEWGITKVLDVACGTGIASIALAQLNVDVVGTDLNADMIKEAQKNATKFNARNALFEVAGMGDSFTGMTTDYDAVFCIGNSIPHILDVGELRRICRHFHSILKPGGKAVIQLKNFEMMTQRDERFVGAHRIGNREYIRFYDFTADNLVFNILRLDWHDDKAVNHDLISTVLHPYQRSDFQQVMGTFARLDFYSTLTLNPFDVDSATDLVIVATR